MSRIGVTSVGHGSDEEGPQIIRGGHTSDLVLASNEGRHGQNVIDLCNLGVLANVDLVDLR